MANRARKKRAGATRAKGWQREMAAFDERVRQGNAAHKARVKTFTKVGIDHGTVATPKPVARVRRKKKGIGPAQLAFWLSVRECVGKRRRGEPGYGTSPATRFTP